MQQVEIDSFKALKEEYEMANRKIQRHITHLVSFFFLAGPNLTSSLSKQKCGS